MGSSPGPEPGRPRTSPRPTGLSVFESTFTFLLSRWSLASSLAEMQDPQGAHRLPLPWAARGEARTYEGSASEPRAPGVGGAESSVQPFSFIILIRNSPRGDVICPASGNFLQPETSRKTCTSRSWPPLSGYLRAPARLSNREGEVAAGGPRRRRGSDVVAAEQGNTGCNLLPPPPPPPM